MKVEKIHCGPKRADYYFCLIDKKLKKFDENRERKHRYRELCRKRNLARLKP